MILAPIVSRTREGLWNLLESEPERVERGFAIVRRELVVRDGVVVDGIGRDSSGRIVLLFVAVDEDGDEFSHRVFCGRLWVARNERLLLGALADPVLRGADVEAGARVVVLGFDFDEATVDALRAMRVEDLTVLRCEEFLLDGRLHAGFSPVSARRGGGLMPIVGREQASGREQTSAREPVGAREQVAATAAANGSSSDTDVLPHGIVDAEVQRLGRAVVDTMCRLDPNLEVHGDRFARRFVSVHGLMAELFAVGERLYVRYADDQKPRLVCAPDLREIEDSIVRGYLDLVGRASAAAARGEANGPVSAVHVPTVKSREAANGPMTVRSRPDAARSPTPEPRRETISRADGDSGRRPRRDRLRIDLSPFTPPRVARDEDEYEEREELQSFRANRTDEDQ